MGSAALRAFNCLFIPIRVSKIRCIISRKHFLEILQCPAGVSVDYFNSGANFQCLFFHFSCFNLFRWSSCGRQQFVQVSLFFEMDTCFYQTLLNFWFLTFLSFSGLSLCDKEYLAFFEVWLLLNTVRVWKTYNWRFSHFLRSNNFPWLWCCSDFRLASTALHFWALDEFRKPVFRCSCRFLFQAVCVVAAFSTTLICFQFWFEFR